MSNISILGWNVYNRAIVYKGHLNLFVCLSLLTMTNPNQLCDVLFVCSKMADETNVSSKLPVADRTREV